MNEKPNKAPLVTFLVVLTVCLVLTLRMVGPYLLSLFFGATIAMLCYPFYRWLHNKKRWNKYIASGLVSLSILILVIGPAAGMAVMAVKQGIAIGKDLAGGQDLSSKGLVDTLSQKKLVRTFMLGSEDIKARLNKGIQNASQQAAAQILKLVKDIPSLLLQIALSMLACFFFLVDGKRFIQWILGLSALDSDVQEKLMDSFKESTNTTVLAGFAAALCQAVFLSLWFVILGVPGAFIAAVFTFVFTWIPVVGSTPTSISAILYLYTQNMPGKMAVMIVVAIITGGIDNVVRAWVLKGRAGLHPLVGLLSIIGGLDMFGVFGVFLGPTLAAILISLLQIWPTIGGRFGIPLSNGHKRVPVNI